MTPTLQRLITVSFTSTKSINCHRREENQEPPPTKPTCLVLNTFFLAAPIPFYAIYNQFQPQEVAIRELESELYINNDPSDIISTPSDREPHLG